MDATRPPAHPPSSYIITPLLISFAGILFTIFSIVAYHFVMVKYCLRREEARRNRNANILPRSSSEDIPYTGVEENFLKTIPIFCFSSKEEDASKVYKNNNTDTNTETDTDMNMNKIYCVEESECVICLGELEDGEMIRVLPNCKHMFHVQCIDEWFTAHTSCPSCRAPIVAPIKEKEISIRIVDDHQSLDQVDDQASTSEVQSNDSLQRHSVSLVFPMKRKPECPVSQLTRSLSLDRPNFVLINIRVESDKGCSSSSIVEHMIS